jgi:prepilin-type N-terminal cleavage/methylation domain-containing protein
MKIRRREEGFTLIELLIVIAVLGTLAVVVLLALNPIQQLARTRDAGRISAVTQLGHSLEAYATSNNGTYVAENATWMTSLVTAGEIASVPSAIAYSISGISACGVNAQNGFCYDATTAAGGNPVLAFARLEGNSNISRCSSAFSGTNRAYAVYSTALGKGGIACTTNADPTVGGTLNMLP